jgi:hypothetical protein
MFSLNQEGNLTQRQMTSRKIPNENTNQVIISNIDNETTGHIIVEIHAQGFYSIDESLISSK